MRVLMALALLVASCVTALPHGTKTKTIEIVHPWTFGHSPDGTVDVAMKIKNLGTRADRLLRVSSPLASSATLEGGVRGANTEPRRLDQIAIAPGAAVELSLDGQRIVLRGVGRQLSPYDTIPLTLHFERAGAIAIEALVEEG